MFVQRNALILDSYTRTVLVNVQDTNDCLLEGHANSGKLTAALFGTHIRVFNQFIGHLNTMFSCASWCYPT